jgi:hypothetical protein
MPESTATTNQPLAARLRRMLLSRPVLIAGALLVLYALFGFLLAPWLVRHQWPVLLEKQLGAKGALSEVRINPFLLTFEAKGLDIAEKNGPPALQAGRVFIDLETSSLFRWAWTFREIRIERLAINADLDAQSSLNLARLFTPKPEPADNAAAGSKEEPAGLPRLVVQHFALSASSFSFTDHTIQPAARAELNPLDFEVHDVSTLPNQRGEHGLAARLPGGGRLQWQGKLTLVPFDSSGSVAVHDVKVSTLWQFVRDYLTIAEPAGTLELGSRYRLRYGSGALDLQADQLALRVKDLAIADGRTGASLGKLATIALEDGSFDLGQRSLAFGQVRIADGAFNVVVDQDGNADWTKLVQTPAAAPAPVKENAAGTADKSPVAAPWRLSLPRIAIGPLALAATDLSRATPLRVAVGTVEAELAVTAAIGNTPQVTVENAALKIGDVRVRSGDEQEPLVTLVAAELGGGSFDLQKQAAHVQLLRLTGGKTRLDREADGSFGLANAFIARREQLQESGFSVTLDRGEIAGHAVTLADRSFQPAVAYDLEEIRLAVTKTAVPPRGPFPVELALRIKQGGSLKAAGTVDRVKQVADIRVEANDVALAPLDPLIKRDTTLTLASGAVSAGGRVTWNGKSKTPAIGYRGSASVDGLELRLAGSTERLASWQRLTVDDIDLDTGENRLAVAQVNLAGPYAKLVVEKDRSTNFSGVLRPRAAPADAAPAEKIPAAAMAVSIDRVSVDGGELDFADRGLVLPFATNIKALGGSVNGLSSAPASRATLKFEGRIDEYGLARAGGTTQPLAPKKFTDIAVAFRNVALSPLTPYAATFAGRKIASGKLSLDLRYKLDNSQLTGDNKVQLEQFTLGERVTSPSAIDLPLDLAIALLTDTEGKIDLAVPVSGNVDHPEFSYGHVVWQAIGTVITRIVTAPFRALGALFGGDAEKLGEIVFDPGAARLLPTENEKLQRVAEGLQKRPQLKLVVQPVYHAENDGRALRTQAVRGDLAAREGLKLAKGEDPGPVGFDSAKTQRALEIMLDARAGSDAATQFVAAFRKSSGREIDRVSPVLATVGRGAGDRALYVAMHQRLVELQPLPESALADLAKARADAVTAALTGRLKLDPARVGRKTPTAADSVAANNGVALKLSFEPMK